MVIGPYLSGPYYYLVCDGFDQKMTWPYSHCLEWTNRQAVREWTMTLLSIAPLRPLQGRHVGVVKHIAFPHVTWSREARRTFYHVSATMPALFHLTHFITFGQLCFLCWSRTISSSDHRHEHNRCDLKVPHLPRVNCEADNIRPEMFFWNTHVKVI